MFWTDVLQRKIYKAFINGTGETELVTTGLGTPGELASTIVLVFSLAACTVDTSMISCMR